jgi:hypothetical protein
MAKFLTWLRDRAWLIIALLLLATSIWFGLHDRIMQTRKEVQRPSRIR